MKWWRRTGTIARHTGFVHIDGPEGASWPPPRPRGVFWASLLFAVLALGITLVAVAGIVAFGIVCRLSGNCPDMREPPVPALLVIFATLLTVPFFLQAWLRDKRPPIALGFHGRNWNASFVWALVGVLSSAPLLILEIIGTGRWDLAPAALMGVAIGLPIFALQGGSEEVICRGWMMQTIGARHGALIALIASSIFFALLHVDPRETPLGMIVAVVARLPLAFGLGLLALRQGNLWGCFGLHAGWNAGQFGVVSFVSQVQGKDPWNELLAENHVTRMTDVLSVDFIATLVCMLVQFAIIWLVSRQARAKLFAPASAERVEASF